MTKKLLCLTALFPALLCGCMQFELSAEPLMRPPALNQEQLEISTALERAIGDSDIKYKYPETGEQRSAFLFYDLDGDGAEEALVFYQAQSKGAATWMNILQRQQDKWVSLYDVSAPSRETEVDFISFQPLLSGENNIIIGWADEYMNEKCAVVYDYDGTTLKEVYEEEYSQLAFLDLDQNDSLDLLIVHSDPFYETCTVSFVVRNRDITGIPSLERISMIELPYNSAEVLKVQGGKLDVATPALFIDSRVNMSRSEQLLVTQILGVKDGELYNCLDSEEAALSEGTLRPTSSLCQDINDDGILEVPTVKPLPGYEEAEEALYLTQYSQLSSNRSWVPVSSMVINEDQRYRFRFPDDWIGAVTIHSQPESNEWSFVRFNNSLEESSTLLLRLKVYSSKDYHDKFESGYFELLGTQGLFEYYAHIPADLEDPLAMSQRELERAFEFMD